MKKIIALVCALTMTCMVAAGCSDSSSSSSKSESSTSAAAEKDSSAADESTDVPADTNKIEDTLTYGVVEAFKSNQFTIDMVVSSDLTGDMPITMSINNDNYYMMMDMSALGSAKIEMYVIDGKSYIIDSDSKSYMMGDSTDENSAMSSIGLGDTNLDGYTFVGSETADGQICETFTNDLSSSVELASGVTMEASSDEVGMTSTYKYYFNADTKVLEKIESETMGTASTIIINLFSTDAPEIALPDMTDWTEKTADSLFGAVIDSTAE